MEFPHLHIQVNRPESWNVEKWKLYISKFWYNRQDSGNKGNVEVPHFHILFYFGVNLRVQSKSGLFGWVSLHGIRQCPWSTMNHGNWLIPCSLTDRQRCLLASMSGNLAHGAILTILFFLSNLVFGLVFKLRDQGQKSNQCFHTDFMRENIQLAGLSKCLYIIPDPFCGCLLAPHRQEPQTVSRFDEEVHDSTLRVDNILNHLGLFFLSGPTPCMMDCRLFYIPCVQLCPT